MSKKQNLRVAVVMGSKSDYRVMRDAVLLLQDFKIDYATDIVSAHRTPDKLYDFAHAAHERFSVIIAGAGGAAHLPGMIASMTHLPVIGVPIKASISMAGVDSLLSIVQMPKGVPVATVAVDAAANASLLAVRILALQDKELQDKLISYQRAATQQVLSQKLED